MSAQPNNPGVAPVVVPDGHVTVEIDGQSLVVPKGSMIIQAADKAGIPIPRFCYHEKLPIAANCRMCLVDVEKSPKPAPACATPVMDGMKVATRSEKALKYQRSVMEFLLINHPLDCPICDQGGECELQDVSLGYGRSVSRFNERKRVVPDEDIGPLVATEMTRCIQCTRCVRFTADVAGTYELGGMYRGENLQIGTYDGKPLTTELSGNVVDVCPVGALTNKVFQFRARPWELTARESLGYHDAMGSNLFLHVRRGEVLRAVPRDNESVNECWLSDRDRYSHQGLYSEDRAVKPLRKVNGEWKEVSWAEGLAAAKEIFAANQGDDLGVLVHPSASNEEGALLARLAAGLGTTNIDHRINNRDFSDAATAEVFGLPLAEIEGADSIVVFGSNIRHELPLLHARLRKAQTTGNAKIHAVNPVDFDFAFKLASKQIVAPSAFIEALGSVALREAVTASAGNAVLIVGGIAENHPQAAAIRAAARDFAAATGAKLCRIPQGANAVGLARAGVLPAGKDVNAMLAQPRKAYVLYGIEPGLDFADAAAARKALAGAQVVAFSQFACASTRDVADLILPIGALPEVDATLTNLDGREQSARAGGKLPGEAREGWRVLRALGGEMSLAGFEFTDLAGLRASLAPVSVAVSSSAATAVAGEGLEVASTAAIYRTDAVVRRAQALQSHPLNNAPRIVLNSADAARLQLAEGQMAKVGTDAGRATLPVVVDARVAAGAVWIESGHGATAPLGAARVTVVAA
ncbi:NADH-quinone oxidoreductase subunit NuoG [Stenotrophomonas rhizophila]|uniref:NADH-quinone oxidoreductase subunit NuoG n=1 Tax=Stenotrophomonas rhizophila TaxID=216778 RepID=UPI001E5D67F6|nr:NADH-quinone oxidoreductase subunit NuoG [Stenotrophomonas rhizophila]MCC7632881.1 NADH-quinone oxidoreductase subunit G [Stenotrophomonas rhizophila]MCC7662394.1 NADH-quinone oxidoreductase subunit G [Stenotrophomonas rhizophila]